MEVRRQGKAKQGGKEEKSKGGKHLGSKLRQFFDRFAVAKQRV
jgi:hypothetical protein